MKCLVVIFRVHRSIYAASRWPRRLVTRLIVFSWAAQTISAADGGSGIPALNLASVLGGTRRALGDVRAEDAEAD